MLSSVCHLVCYRGCRRRRCEFVIDRLHLRHRSSYQVRGCIYHAYNFQLTVPSSRIVQLLDPTTSYLCLRYKPQTAMSLHIPVNHVLLCYYCSLLSPCLVCMLGLYLLLSCLSLVWLSHYYVLFVDDMIIINVDYIRRRMEGRAIPSDVLFHSSHLGPEFRVLVPRLSVPNRVWDARSEE